MLWRPLLLSAVICWVALRGCESTVEVSPPPPEERYQSPFPPPLGSFIEMAQPDAGRYVVSGIADVVDQQARRAAQKAALRFLVPPYLDLKFAVRFLLPEAALREARTMALRVRINQEFLAEATFDQAGEHVFEKYVPQQYLPWDRETLVSLELLPARGEAVSNKQLDFFLISAGFHL